MYTYIQGGVVTATYGIFKTCEVGTMHQRLLNNTNNLPATNYGDQLDFSHRLWPRIRTARKFLETLELTAETR